jgi:integrase
MIVVAEGPGPPAAATTAWIRLASAKPWVSADLAAHLVEYGPGPGGLIFTTAIGTPVCHSTWSGVWRRGRPDELAGVGFHALRHFYASTLIRGGCTVKEVQERLGHSSAAMTLDIYSHLFPADEDRTRVVTDEALSQLPSEKCSPDIRPGPIRQRTAQFRG